ETRIAEPPCVPPATGASAPEDTSGSKVCQGRSSFRKGKRRGGSPAPSSERPKGCGLVAGALNLVVPVGEDSVVEVQFLLVEVGPAVTERDLARRVLGLRRHALALDTRSLSSNLRAGLRRRAGAEVRPLRAIRSTAPGARRLCEDHRRDGQG